MLILKPLIILLSKDIIFNLDLIDRESLVPIAGNGVNQRETKFLFGITLRGLGTVKRGDGKISERLFHREFESIKP